MSRMRRIDLHDTILSRDFRGCFTVFIGKAGADPKSRGIRTTDPW